MRRLLLVFAAFASLLAGPAMAADKLTVLLDWFLNPDHAPLVVAEEGGFFAKYGLDVTLVAPADPSAPPRLVAAGQGDIAIGYQPDLMFAVDQGLPLVRFGTLVDTPLNCLIVLKNGPIKSLADLKGKKIGYSLATSQALYIDAILGSAGLSTKDVTLVNVNFNLVTALASGQIDAAIDGYRNVEMVELEQMGTPGVAYYPEEHGVPSYDELIYETRASMKDDPRLPRFLAAMRDATAFIAAHPDQALAMFVKAHPDLDDALDRESFALTVPHFAADPALLDIGRYQAFAAFLVQNGLIKAAPAIGTYAVELKMPSPPG